jgi:hypothetical protein
MKPSPIQKQIAEALKEDRKRAEREEQWQAREAARLKFVFPYTAAGRASRELEDFLKKCKEGRLP